MLYIYKILEKFLALFSKNKPRTNNVIGQISFSVSLEKQTIDISCSVPEENDLNIQNIPIFAEKFAELLCSLSLGDLTEKLHSHIERITKDTNTSPNHVLFFNNVISFWGLLQKHKIYEKIKIDQYECPIIKPSKVFKI